MTEIEFIQKLHSEIELYHINNVLGILEDANALGPY